MDIANTYKHAEDWARDASGEPDGVSNIIDRLRLRDGMAFADPYLFRDAADEIDRLRKVLFYLVEYLAEADEEGLAEPMQLARKVLGKSIRYVCTHGHDRCFQMSAGPECPTCERRP